MMVSNCKDSQRAYQWAAKACKTGNLQSEDDVDSHLQWHLTGSGNTFDKAAQHGTAGFIAGSRTQGSVDLQ